jgi:hypothetical protein
VDLDARFVDEFHGLWKQKSPIVLFPCKILTQPLTS